MLLGVLAAFWALATGPWVTMGNRGKYQLVESAVNLARCRVFRQVRGKGWEKVPW